LFRHLLLQIGGGNISKPSTSSSLADEMHVGSLLLSTAARDPRLWLLAPLAAHHSVGSGLCRLASGMTE
jgi:hypothetical protein